MGEAVYYEALGGGRYRPTEHVEGAWNDAEQHMAPVSGLIVHAIERHDPRPELQLGRISFDILGMIPLADSLVEVSTVRPGRTIELVEASMVVGGRTVVRARAWRLSRQDTTAVSGGAPEPMPGPEQLPDWDGSGTWPGGYIRSLVAHRDAASGPGRGRVWLGSRAALVDEPFSATAAFVGLVDTANGIAVRQDPREWMFPNVDLGVHLHRAPMGLPVGLDTTVTFGPDGLGLTSSVLHDVHGPVGRAEQVLTVRPLRR